MLHAHIWRRRHALLVLAPCRRRTPRALDAPRWRRRRTTSAARAAGLPRRRSMWCRSTSRSSTARTTTSPISTKQEFTVFEDGARQELIFFNRTSLPIALSLLIDTSASMENRLQIAQDAAIGFARKLRAAGLRAGRGLRQPRRDRAGLHEQRRRARARDSRHDGRRLDVAPQRALHLAEGARQDQGEDRRTRSGAGRSSCCRTARTPRAWSATKR